MRFLTAGESHGKCLSLIVEGVPAGLCLSADDINRDLRRRQLGYGRGNRMKIETDSAEITAGVRNGVTLASPISVIIQNKDWENWKDIMSIEDKGDSSISDRSFSRPRPGHADFAGGIKYNQKDLRNILERASARETAIRVAVGAIAKKILDEINVFVTSFVTQIGKCSIANVWQFMEDARCLQFKSKIDFLRFQERIDSSPVRCPEPEAEKQMIEEIDSTKNSGDSIGGVFQVMAFNVPVGLGTHVHWDRRLDARIAYALMSIPAIKGVEFGLGFELAKRKGSKVHDEIFYDSEKGFYHRTNNAGGIEGGISNGETIVVKAVMKPIPTLTNPLKSVDLISKEPFMAFKERSDVCAVPSAGVVAEAMVAVELANAMLEKFGSDSISEIKQAFKSYMEYIAKY
ncbi:TPA: chorismate synthase [Candidatus Poribacteria bacterium]|nr:chorismate synthase [Candidatus Poribacteria bacterium]